MKKSKIESSTFKKEWGEGKAKTFFHDIKFVGDPTTYNIGAKKIDPDFLAPGQFLTYEVTDTERNKIKRVKEDGFQNAKQLPKVDVNAKSLIRVLENVNESDIVFLDIETARGVKELEEGSALHDAWMYKARYQNEVDRKTGEVMSAEEYFIDKAALYAPFAKVVAIVAGRIVDGTLKTKKYLNTGKEKATLKEFNDDMIKILNANPNTVFCGWANVGFDQPFLMKRMIVHGIQPNILLDTAHLKPWEISSIDLKELWRGTSFYPDSLISVAVTMGLPSPKSKMDGSQVSDAFYEGKIEEIAEYCEQDVLTTANVYRKFRGEGKVTL